MPIYYTNHNSLSRTWIYAKNSQNYFQTEKNHQKKFQLNRRKKGDQPHPNIYIYIYIYIIYIYKYIYLYIYVYILV